MTDQRGVDPCQGCMKECNETCPHYDPCVHGCERSFCPDGCPYCTCDRPECVAEREKRRVKEEERGG